MTATTEEAATATSAATAAPSTLEYAALPAPGAELAGGIFAGLTTTVAGLHCAVVLLPGQGSQLTWEAAQKWAARQGGQLPTRPVAALLYALVKPALRERWHWTADEYEFDASYAWSCDFYDGHQFGNLKSYEGCAVAVRLIPIES